MDTLTRQDRLEAVRGVLEAAIAELAGTASPALPALVREYRQTLAEIDDLEAAKPSGKGTALDELGQRRRAAGRPDATRANGSEGTTVRR